MSDTRDGGLDTARLRALAEQADNLNAPDYSPYFYAGILATAVPALLAENERLTRERDDWRLSFETSNEHVGKLEARVAALEQEKTELATALTVVHQAVRGDEKSEYWSARKWLDDRNVFNGDLADLRVIEAVCRKALKGQP